MTPPRLLIVDDHQLVAEGLMRLLGDRFEIVATINDGSAVVDAVARLQPDVVLLDLSMPTISGFEAMRQLKQQQMDVKLVVLTMHADPDLAVEALKAGASGYVLKESSGSELLTALQVVLRGDTYLATSLTKEVVKAMVGAGEHSRVTLSQPQREVLRLILQGQQAKEIAAVLHVSVSTVQHIKSSIMNTLNVRSTAELVRYTVEHRLVAF
jgi:DNA-binding NarL/FixJ family response regulator